MKLNSVQFYSALRSTSKKAVLLIYLLPLILFSTLQASELETAVSSSTTITLTWTATGDNGFEIAPYYDMRYSMVPISNSNWDNTIKVENIPAPKLRGSAESFIVMELTPDTDYYFAIKVGDESGNWSELSNIPMLRTASPPSCGELDESGRVDITDLVSFVAYMFLNGIPQFNLDIIDVNASGVIDISDLVYFVNYMFKDGPALNCLE